MFDMLLYYNNKSLMMKAFFLTDVNYKLVKTGDNLIYFKWFRWGYFDGTLGVFQSLKINLHLFDADFI